MQQVVAARQQGIQSNLNSNNLQGALNAVLTNPPYGIEDPALKASDRQTVANVLSQFKKEADITGAVSRLDDAQLDILMKYIYAGMAVQENSKELLMWHASVLAKAGQGCIVRTLSDRVHTL